MLCAWVGKQGESGSLAGVTFTHRAAYNKRSAHSYKDGMAGKLGSALVAVMQSTETRK